MWYVVDTGSDGDYAENNELNNGFVSLDLSGKVSAVDNSESDTNVVVCEYDASSPTIYA